MACAGDQRGKVISRKNTTPTACEDHKCPPFVPIGELGEVASHGLPVCLVHIGRVPVGVTDSEVPSVGSSELSAAAPITVASSRLRWRAPDRLRSRAVHRSDRSGAEFIKTDEGTIPITTDLQLDRPEVTFFGLDESIFSSLAALVRSRDTPIADIVPLPDQQFVYSGISALRDGSIIGLLSFFRLVERRTYYKYWSDDFLAMLCQVQRRLQLRNRHDGLLPMDDPMTVGTERYNVDHRRHLRFPRCGIAALGKGVEVMDLDVSFARGPIRFTEL
jgi:hypothetical protein